MLGSRFPILALLVFGCGCRHSPESYRLVREGLTAILIPPARTASRKVAGFEVRVKDARKNARPETGCDINGDLIALRWRGRSAEIRLAPESYFPAPGDSSSGETGSRAYLDPLRSLESFRADLLDRQAKGCLRPDDGRRLMRAVAESFPMPSSIAYFLRFGSYSVTGFVDLTSDFRLQVVSPIYSSGEDSTKLPIGYDTSYYSLTPVSRSDDRIRVSLVSVSTREAGKALAEKSMPQHALPLPESAGYFRLLFWTSASSANYLATLLRADDEAKLNEATRRFQVAPEHSCQAVVNSGATCITVPPNFAVNLELGVRANGKEVFVSLGGTVAEAMGLRGRPTATPPTLQVCRMFRGRLTPVKFDPASRDILGLVLMPGDEVSW